MATPQRSEDPTRQQVDFFFDFISPYTYLAQTQLPALKTRSSATFRLWPMHLLNLMKRVGNSPTTVLCANKMKYAGADIGRWVSRYGVPFEFNPHVFAADQSLALRAALVAQDQGAEEAYNRAVFSAFWAEGIDAEASERRSGNTSPAADVRRSA